MSGRVTFLPAIHGNATIAAQGDADGMNARAQQFAEAWLALLGDRAALMVCSPKLVRCAQDHAQYLAQRLDTLPSLHVGRHGSTPNRRVREAGYALPLWHRDGNTVESAKRTWEDLDADMTGIVARLMEHETHHDHMHGIGFWEASIVYGVGAASEPSGSTYFVALRCPPEKRYEQCHQ